jgi:ABC-type antimicrobial peptide transport system permease subunit
MYVDYAWESFARFHVVLQTDRPSEAVVRGLRAAIGEIDAGLPLADVVTLEAVESRALAQPAFYATIFSSFGIAALLLALIGVYGTTAYATSSRSREIGIRVALGEARERIVFAILRRTAIAVGAGVALGSLAALAAGRFAGDALHLVEVGDPFTYIGVAALVLSAALAAAWMPASRLTRIDPARTLRDETS